MYSKYTLDVCWKFAGSCKHPITSGDQSDANTLNDSTASRKEFNKPALKRPLVRRPLTTADSTDIITPKTYIKNNSPIKDSQDRPAYFRTLKDQLQI